MVRNVFTTLFVLVQLALLPTFGLAQEADEGEAGASLDTEDRLFWVHAIEEYRGRFAIGSGTIDPGTDVGTTDAFKREDESDHDLRLYLGAGIRDRKDRFAGRISAGFWYDIDGLPSSDGFTTLGSMRDDSAFEPEVYTLWGEYHANVSAGKGALVRFARVGRQTAEVGLPATFDGASIRLRPLAPYLDVFAFGGRTVHFFESDADLFEDWIASAGAEVRPIRSLRLIVDYRMQMEDQTVDAAAGDPAGVTRKSLTDHGYGLAAWYKPAHWARLKLYGRGLTDQFAHAGGAGRFLWDAIDLGFDFKVDAQLVTLNEVNEMMNPYFAILGKSQPNLRWKADLYKNFATTAGDYALHAGWAGRKVLEDAQGPFNRDFGRLYFLASATDIGIKGPFVAVIAEAHFTGLTPEFNGSEGFLTVGGSAGWEDHRLKAEAGTYYQRYKYQYYRQVEEIADVRTYFGSVGYKITDWLKAQVRYEFDQFDWNIHSVFVSLSQSY